MNQLTIKELKQGPVSFELLDKATAIAAGVPLGYELEGDAFLNHALKKYRELGSVASVDEDAAFIYGIFKNVIFSIKNYFEQVTVFEKTENLGADSLMDLDSILEGSVSKHKTIKEIAISIAITLESGVPLSEGYEDGYLGFMSLKEAFRIGAKRSSYGYFNFDNNDEVSEFIHSVTKSASLIEGVLLSLSKSVISAINTIKSNSLSFDFRNIEPFTLYDFGEHLTKNDQLC